MKLIAKHALQFSFTMASFVALASISMATTDSSEISGFRYHNCIGAVCVLVQAPKGSLSSSTEDFVATGDGTHGAILRLIFNGKTSREFQGYEVVSRMAAHVVTINSQKQIAIINLKTGSYELLKKGDGR